jgi:hypothetical protein
MGRAAILRDACIDGARAPPMHAPQLIAFYKRLRANGKTHKMALVACARKLLIFINTVVARATPWQPKPATI